MHEDRDHRVVVTTTEARQASPRKTNFRVLVVSLILAFIAAGVLYTYFYSQPTAF
jgi:hypothetical protein